MIKAYNGCCISEKNDKMGNIPSFSTLPGETCRPDAPCSEGCYAMKMLKRFRQNVRASWAENTKLVKEGKFEEIREDITSYVRFKKCGLFRWFVGGDIDSEGMLDTMIGIAQDCPETRFLVFTKKYDLVGEKEIPENLSVVLSAWKELRPSEELCRRFPVCYMDDGTPECGIPADAFQCGGHCIDCQLCFALKPGSSVKIKKH